MNQARRIAEKILEGGVNVKDLLCSEDELFEMANLHPQTTGLKHVVWFSGDPVAKHHRPRGKIRVEHKFYPFSIDEPVQWLVKPAPGVSSKDFSKIAEYVELNRAVLMAYWNGDIDTHAFIAGLRKLGDAPSEADDPPPQN